MKRLFLFLLIFTLIPSVVLAQTRMEKLGLKGPVKEMVLESGDDYTIYYSFTPSGTISRELTLAGKTNSYDIAYDSYERPLVSSYQKSFVIYDDEKLTFTRYEDKYNISSTGVLNSDKTISKEFYKSGISKYNIYDNSGNLISEETVTNDNKKRIVNYTYNSENQIISVIHDKDNSGAPNKIYTYDNSTGFPVSCTITIVGHKYKNFKTFIYLKVDDHGNWIEKKEITEIGDEDKVVNVNTKAITRKITYYE